MIISFFVFLTFLLSNKVLAVLPPDNVYRDNNIDVQIKLPTATPTPIIFKKIDPNINLQLIPTATPTLGTKLTVTPEPTLGTKLTVTPEPTLDSKLTVAPTQNGVEISPSVAATKTEEKLANKQDLSRWFINITLGLLVLIIITQSWPKKKEN